MENGSCISRNTVTEESARYAYGNFAILKTVPNLDQFAHSNAIKAQLNKFKNNSFVLVKNTMTYKKQLQATRST